MFPFSYPTSADELQNMGLGLTVVAFSIAFALAIGSAALNWKINKTKRAESRLKDEKVAREFQEKQVLIANAEKKAAEATAEAAKATEGLAKSNLEIARLNAETEQAKKEIAEASVKIAQAQAVAATANEKAESERLIRIKLEESLASVFVKVTNEMTDELKLFEGTKVIILWADGSQRLAGQINFMVAMAGWNILNIHVPYPEYPTDEGVTLYTRSTAEASYPAAEILSYQLKDSKVETRHVRGQTLTFWPADLPESAVIIHVGIMRNRYLDLRSRDKTESQLDESARQRFQEVRREEKKTWKELISYDPQKRRQLVEQQKERLKTKPPNNKED